MVVVAVLAAALTACSVGSIGRDKSIHDTTRILGKRVDVTVTTDGGRKLIIRRNVRMSRGMTALEALQAVSDVRLAAGGVIAQVNGLGGGRATALGPDQSAWTYRVNGIDSNVDPKRFRLKPGQSVWWDLRRFDIYQRMPVAIGNFPEPLFSGWRDTIRPIRIAYGEGFQDDAEYFRDTIFQQFDPDVRPLRDDGSFSMSGNVPAPLVAVRKDRSNFIIGRWEDLRLDPFVLDIALDPRGYGLTTWVEGHDIRHQDPDDEFSVKLDDAEGVVWASTIDGEPDGAIVFVVTGLTKQGVRAAARALHDGALQFYVSGAVDRDGVVLDPSQGTAPPPRPPVDPRVEP